MAQNQIERSPYVALLLRLGERLEEGRARRVFCNRDLNMARIHWIGFDMDYTLAVYKQDAFDALCHRLTMSALSERFGYPAEIGDIPYDPGFAIRGLTIDRELGHILKTDSYGYVRSGVHGLDSLPDDALDAYRNRPPRLSSRRYETLDTLFELPEAYAYAALVAFLEARGQTPDYNQLAVDVRNAIDGIHADGSLKSKVVADLDRYIRRDAQLGVTLHRFRSAGKRLFLMTNSFPAYTEAVMSYLLADGPGDYKDWRSYFDYIVTGASKPRFFDRRSPFCHATPDGERGDPVDGPLARGTVYVGGNLPDLEQALGATGDEILYVGDHIYGDILRSKRDSGWRTAMIIPELEDELRTLDHVGGLIDDWFEAEEDLARVRDALSYELELKERVSDPTYARPEEPDTASWDAAVAGAVRGSDRLAKRRRKLIERIRQLARDVDTRFHPRWGQLMKAGNEHSIFGQQVERFADLYTSRVTNFLASSPTQYHRAPPSHLPHEIEALQRRRRNALSDTNDATLNDESE